FVPLLFSSALGHLNARRMWIWMGIATLICVLMSVYDIWRWHIDFIDGNNLFGEHGAERTPSGLLLLFVAGGFYIAHALVLAAATDGRRIARYPTYFETAWKLIIQVKFSILFVIVLW